MFRVKFPSWYEEKEEEVEIFVVAFPNLSKPFLLPFRYLFNISLLPWNAIFLYFFFFFFSFRKANSDATRNEKPSTNARTRETREILVFDNSSASSAVDRDPASDLYRDGMNHPRRQKEPDKYITVCRCREITKIRAWYAADVEVCGCDDQAKEDRLHIFPSKPSSFPPPASRRGES